MNSHEYTDPDHDALTITTRGDQVWITCTTETTEVTIGPIPAEKLRPVFGGPDPLDTDGGVTAALIEQETECGYCHHPASDSCAIEDGPTRYRCNRRQGHAGEHVACTDSDHYLAAWDSPQEPRPEGAEAIEDLLLESPLGPAAVCDILADYLAEHGVRATGGES